MTIIPQLIYQISRVCNGQLSQWAHDRHDIDKKIHVVVWLYRVTRYIQRSDTVQTANPGFVDLVLRIMQIEWKPNKCRQIK